MPDDTVPRGLEQEQDPPEREPLDVEVARDPAMKQDLAARGQAFPSLKGLDVFKLGDVFAKSGFFGTSGDLEKQQAQAVVKILAGAELGLSPFASMTGIYMVEGKPMVGGNLMASLFRQSPRYRYTILQLDNEFCELALFEKDPATGEWVEVEPHFTFSIGDAQTADLATKPNWKRYPRNMLFWRCLSNMTRFAAADLLQGAPVYTPDELGVVVNEDGSIEGDGGPSVLDHRPTRTALPPRAQPTAQRPGGQAPQPAGAAKPTEPVVNAAQKRKLFAEAEKAGIKDQGAIVRSLMVWTTGEEHTDRIPKAKFDAFLEAIKDHEAAQADLFDTARGGDERALGIVAKFFPDVVLAEPDEPPASGDAEPEAERIAREELERQTDEAVAAPTPADDEPPAGGEQGELV